MCQVITTGRDHGKSNFTLITYVSVGNVDLCKNNLRTIPEQGRVLLMNNAITTGQTIQFSSQCKAANGTWRAYNIQGEMVRLGRVGARGQMLTPNASNLLSLPAALIAEAVTVGTAVLA